MSRATTTASPTPSAAAGTSAAGAGAPRLRRATADDHDDILALPGLGRSTRSLLSLDLAGAKARHIVVCVDAAGQVLGFAEATRQPDEVHLLDIAVAPAQRRRGHACRLVAWLAAQAGADGAQAMTLEVRVSNDAGLALYRRLGFVDHGVRPGYYQDGEDAVIMWHHDLAALAVAPPDPVAAPATTRPDVPHPPTRSA